MSVYHRGESVKFVCQRYARSVSLLNNLKRSNFCVGDYKIKSNRHPMEANFSAADFICLIYKQCFFFIFLTFHFPTPIFLRWENCVCMRVCEIFSLFVTMHLRLWIKENFTVSSVIVRAIPLEFQWSLNWDCTAASEITACCWFELWATNNKQLNTECVLLISSNGSTMYTLHTKHSASRWRTHAHSPPPMKRITVL